MGLDDLGKAPNAYKKWFMSIADKTDTYINNAIESMGDPFKYNGLTNNLRKSSINNLTDYLKDIQEYKENSIKQINSAFEKAQKIDGDMIDEIRPLYQQALDQINTSVENVSIYEQQLVGLKNAEKYKEGTKAFNRGFKNTRGEEIIKQEIEIEDIWDKDRKAQQKLYNDTNKHYTQTYHPEIDNTNRKYYSDRNSAFLDDDALKRYETLKQMAPGITITEQSYNWETDIDKAHELALKENNQFDLRRAEEIERRRVNNNTTAQNQVNNSSVPKTRKLKNATKSYRPEIKMEGNNVEIDSIYNHSVPRRIHNSNNAHSPEQNELDQEINRTEAEHRQRTSSTSTSEPDVNMPDPEPYTPKIGDNIIDDTGERYVLKEIDKADPSLDIHSDTYYYVSPNGDRITQSTPIDPTNPNGRYFLDDEILTPDDVYRINHSFEDLRMNYDNYEQAKGQLYELKNAYENGADNLNEIYEMEKSVRYLEKKLAETRKQIYDDDVKYNSGDKWAYNINEKTQKYIDKTDNVLKDYSETKYHNNYDEVFKDVKPRQTIKPIESGIDDTFKVTKGSTVKNNIKTRTRGKKKNVQTTGRGNRKTRTQSTGRSNKIKKTKVKSSGGKDLPNLKRRGKSSKLRAVGRNGKVLNNVPRVKVPLSKKDIVKTAANLIVNEAATNTASTIIKNIDDINTPDVDTTPDLDFNNYDDFDDPSKWTDEDIRDMADGDPDLYQELLNRREQARNGGEGKGGDANTDSNKFANDPNDPTTWSDDYIEEMSEGDPHYYEELKQRREKAFEETINSQGPKPPGPFSDNFDPNDPSTWTDNDKRRMNTPDQWTDDDIRRLADGDMDRANELNRMRNGEFGPYDHNPINDFDFNDAPAPDTSYKHAPDTEILDNSISTKTLSKMDIAMTGLNVIGAIGDYKSYRREGDGVISAGIKTGAKFAIEEALGFWALPIALVKTVPGMAIKGADALYKENRRMNSAANFTLFGDAQFMDTQQLATMRQSGMEMAKMSQYNLQQTLMGNEATYLHR